VLRCRIAQMRRGAIPAALLALVAAIGPAAAEPTLLSVPNGTYRAAEPPGWDRTSPLPLVLYLHGYHQSSGEVMEDAPLVGAVTAAGALLVVPDGANGSWAHVGSPSHARDDIAFLRAVVADTKQRWPIDSRHVIAAGFSQGASMVWDLACHAADGFTAFLPVSGDFWLPYPERCESGPVNLRHVHGLDDHTVPMSGRTIRLIYQQGDIMKSFAILRATDRCAEAPDRKTDEGNGLSCGIWNSCGGGALQLCLHGGDHVIQPEWLSAGILWAMTRPPPAE
jgi:polyhydroxybutyrate depolymerase